MMLQCYGCSATAAPSRATRTSPLPTKRRSNLMHGILRDTYDEAGVLSVDIDNFTNLADAEAAEADE